MLDDEEWERVSPLMRNPVAKIKQYRQIHHVSLLEAKQKGYGQDALDLYFEITGYRETNADALWHHRQSVFGPPCRARGKPLRTPRARFCAECGDVK
jgi:hypothetical protein